jgi:hypothetical protein
MILKHADKLHTHTMKMHQAEEDITRSTARLCRRKGSVVTCESRSLVKSICISKLRLCKESDLAQEATAAPQNEPVRSEVRTGDSDKRDNIPTQAPSTSSREEKSTYSAASDTSTPNTQSIDSHGLDTHAQEIEDAAARKPEDNYTRHATQAPLQQRDDTGHHDHVNKKASSRTPARADSDPVTPSVSGAPPVTLTLPGFEAARSSKHSRRPPSTSHAHEDAHAKTHIRSKHDLKTSWEQHGAEPAQPQSSGTDAGGGAVSSCSSHDWDKYGILLDVDDLQELPCADFETTACRRCRSVADCDAKRLSCTSTRAAGNAQHAAASSVSGKSSSPEKAPRTKKAASESPSPSPPSRQEKETPEPGSTQQSRARSSSPENTDESRRGPSRRDAPGDDDAGSGCSPPDWDKYGVLMDVDDLGSMQCSDFDVRVCARCRGSKDCSRKMASCGVVLEGDAAPSRTKT